ncbi:predicted protein, partial [Thalassiosira pseudonana CCMP1335]
FLAPCATLIGNVHLAPKSSVFYKAIIKADVAAHAVNRTNIQDACIVTAYEDHTTIGEYVTVGHGAQIHSATVGDECLIGMGSMLKPGSVVESQSFVAAGAVVERGAVVKSGEIWGGNPARKLRELSAAEKGRLRMQAEKVIRLTKTFVSN